MGNKFLCWLHLTEQWLKQHVANENVFALVAVLKAPVSQLGTATAEKRIWFTVSLKHRSPSCVFPAQNTCRQCIKPLSNPLDPDQSRWPNSLFFRQWSHTAHPDGWQFKSFYLFPSWAFTLTFPSLHQAGSSGCALFNPGPASSINAIKWCQDGLGKHAGKLSSNIHCWSKTPICLFVTS